VGCCIIALFPNHKKDSRLTEHSLFRKVHELEAQRKENSERLCLRAGEAQKIRETLASEVCVCVCSFVHYNSEIIRNYQVFPLLSEMKEEAVLTYIVFSHFFLSRFHQHTHT
jgi:hypothetical protein